MIPLLAVLTAFLSGAALGIAIAEIRTRRQQDEERAQRVADALSDTVLVDGVELPKPEDGRWTYREFTGVENKERVLTVVIGEVAVSEARIYIAMHSMPETAATNTYIASVWRAHRSRVSLKSVRGSA